MSKQISVLFLIRSLHIGGTERQLVAIAKGLDKQKFKVHVALLYGEGKLLDELTVDKSITVVDLKKKGRWDIFRFTCRLVRYINDNSFDVVYSFLPDVNLIGLMVVKASYRSKHLIWGIRASNMDLRRYGWLPMLTYRLQSWLAGIPDAVISNSEAGLKCLLRSNLSQRNTKIIPNGIDVCRFSSNAATRNKVRHHLDIKDSEYLIGITARIDPMKGYETFIMACSKLVRELKNLRFICIGAGSDVYKKKLMDLARRQNISQQIIWYGSCSDMPKMYNAMDVACSTSSFGEGFSNAVAEAMACGVPCVVTDVGDSRKIVGDTGVVVPPDDPVAFADGLLKVLEHVEKKGSSLSMQARKRIEDYFGLDNMVAKSSKLMETICHNG